MRLCFLFLLLSLNALGQVKMTQLINAERLLTTNPQKALIVAKEAYNLATKKSDLYTKAVSSLLLSDIYQKLGNFQLAGYYDSVSIHFAKLIDDSLLLQKAFNNYAFNMANQGNLEAAERILNENEYIFETPISKETIRRFTIKSFCYFKQMKSDDAIQNCKSGLHIAFVIKDSTNIFRLKGLIGEMYLRLKASRDSVQLIYDAMEYLEKTNNFSYAADNASAIAYTFQTAFDLEKWMLYSQKALELSLKENDLYQIAKMRIRLGDVYLNQKKYADAKEYFTKSNNFYQSIKNKPGLASSSIFLGMLYTQIDRYDSATYFFNLVEQLNKDLNLKSVQFVVTTLRVVLQGKMKNYKAVDSLIVIGGEIVKNNFDKDLIAHTIEVQKKGNFFSDEEARQSDSFFLSPKATSSNSNSNILLAPMTPKQIENLSELNIYTGSAKVLDTAYIESNNRQVYQTDAQYNTRLFKDSLRVQTQQNTIDKQQLKLAEQRVKARNRTLLFSAALVLFISLGLWLQYKSRRRAERDKAKIELLQNEIHHRVKNNLAVINRLVEVAGKNSVEDAPLATLKNRIKSIELLHNHLYSNEAKTGNISLQSYFEDLCLAIAATFQTAKDIQINVQAPTEVDSTIAEKLGLILNELVTNSFKYAFENKEKGAITVTAKPEGKQLNITVQDNGIGMPTEKNTKSYGMKLIKGLSNELNGKFAFQNIGGTSFQLSIPLSAA